MTDHKNRYCLFFSLNKQDGCQCNICIGVWPCFRYELRVACSVFVLVYGHVSGTSCEFGICPRAFRNSTQRTKSPSTTCTTRWVGSFQCIDHPFVRSSELTLTANKMRKIKLHNVIMHNVKKTESLKFVYHWLRAHAVVDVTCFPAFVGALNVFSSFLSKR